MKLLKEARTFAKGLSAEEKRRMVGTILAATAVVGSAMTAMASEASASASISTALQNGLNQTVTDFVGYVALVLPIGLTVFGVAFGVKKAKVFFKTVAS